MSRFAAGRLERGLNKQRSIRFIGERRRKIPPGESVRQHVADNLYAIRFKFFTLTQNVFTGWTIIAGETTVDATGETNAGFRNCRGPRPKRRPSCNCMCSD